MKSVLRTAPFALRWIAPLLLPAPSLATGEIITVTTLNDVRDFGGAQRIADLPGPDGRVSFGEAVTAANNEPGPQAIHFAIPIGEYWLVPQIALLKLEIGPFVLTDDSTTVDFRTQTDFAGDTNPVGWEVGIYGLEANGWGAAAIIVSGDDCTLIGLDDVYQRGYAVQLIGNNNRVMGFTTNGPIHAAIQVQGLFGLSSATGNVIGGTGPGEGNVVSGGDTGISIAGPADDNVVIGNVCTGSPAAGIQVVGATRYGVFVRRNRIGGSAPGERNWAAGNGSYGEEGLPGGTQISVWDADDTLVEGNYAGTTGDGLADYPVQQGPAGILVRDSRGTIVRGNLASGGVQIGVNHYQGQRFGVGIGVEGICEGTRIVGNLVGTDASGEHPIPNVVGIAVDSTTALMRPFSTVVGAVDPGQGNTVAFNERTGIRIGSLVTTTEVRANRVFENGGLGIDLESAAGGGVTPNDPLDLDADGGNHLQNFPVLSRAFASSGAGIVRGTLDSTPLSPFAIDLFASPTRDPSGHGEGQVYLVTIPVMTDAAGHAAVLASFSHHGLPGWFVSATATNLALGETSEFSAGLPLTSLPRIHP